MRDRAHRRALMSLPLDEALVVARTDLERAFVYRMADERGAMARAKREGDGWSACRKRVRPDVLWRPQHARVLGSSFVFAAGVQGLLKVTA